MVYMYIHNTITLLLNDTEMKVEGVRRELKGLCRVWRWDSTVHTT